MHNMKGFFSKPYRWAGLFSLVLAASSLFVLLDAFVIPHVGTPVSALSAATRSTATVTQSAAASTASQSAAAGAAVSSATSQSSVSAGSGSVGSNASASAASGGTPVITASSYKDANIQISIETIRQNNTNIYLADIQVSSVDYLKTAFASNTFGRNIKAATSSIAASNQAIFAINGDYYGFRTTGFVLRNGVLYRNTAQTSVSSDGLVIDSKGNFSIIDETKSSADQLASSGSWQILTFGPALVNNGKITVTAGSEVGQSMASNPRTAIGQISERHYLVVVSDGRTSQSTGLSLLQLAQVMKDRGCTVAYNLDGGGSSTMWFNGQIVNNPTDGRTSGERQVSDIVYFGY